MRSVTVTPTISVAIYAAGDAVGGLLTFALAPDAPIASGKITGVTVIDRGAQSAPLVLQLFKAAITPSADNAAYAVSDADAANAIGNVSIVAGDYAGGTLNKVATKQVELPFALPQGTSSVFGQLSTSGTPTYASVGDLSVVLHYALD